MGKMERKKVGKTLLALSEETRTALENLAKADGLTMKQATEHAILGTYRYSPRAEEAIEAYREMHKCSRRDAIQDLITQGIKPQPK